MRKTRIILPLLSILLVLLLAVPAAAQDESPALEISLRRDFGYGGFANDIQGTFTIKANGPDTLEEVQFYLDDTLMATDSEAPFSLQFNTDNFEPGVHDLSAVGSLSDGTQVSSNVITAKFLSNEEAQGKTIGIVGPILGITVVLVLLGGLIPLLTGKKGATGPIGEYSLAGGTVCPRCKLPFSRHNMSPNLMLGKLERCPHCGKWSIRPRASQADLAAAEERLRAKDTEKAQIEVDPEESIRRALDDSRFDE
jgi:hypothetical protein